MKRFSDSDFLRLAASFAVVLNHAAGANTPKNVYSSGFAAVCAINAVSHFSVPVFIMISGRFMLGRDKNISGAIKHALKCVIWIAVWSVIYFADKLFFYGAAEAFSAREPQHLWYLYTAAGLYMASPALSVFAVNASERVYRYTLALGVGVCSVLRVMTEFAASAAVFVEKTHIDTAFGFMWCSLMGYYIYNREISKKIVPLAVCGAAVTVFGTIAVSVFNGAPDYRLLSFLSPNVLIYSAGIVYGVKAVFKRNNILYCKRISNAAQTTGIIYGIHILILEKLSDYLTVTGCIKRTVILSLTVWIISASIGAVWNLLCHSAKRLWNKKGLSRRKSFV